MLAYTAMQIAEATQYVDTSYLDPSFLQSSVDNLAQDDPAGWWEKIKDFAQKALVGMLILIAVIFLLGTWFGLWIGKKWGRRSARKAYEEARETGAQHTDPV